VQGTARYSAYTAAVAVAAAAVAPEVMSDTVSYGSTTTFTRNQPAAVAISN